MTTTEAQAYLAEQLPDKLFKGDDNYVYWTMPSGYPKQCHPIIETEWLQIAHEVEGKMTDEQWDLFENCMFRVYAPLASTISWRRFMSNATYTQRAIAMKESGL